MTDMHACPFCHSTTLVQGHSEMRSWLGIFGGAGPTFMEFFHELTEFDVLSPAERKLSYRCEACGAVTVLDESVTV